MILKKFYGVWCAPCKLMAPIIQEVADLYGYELEEHDIELDTDLVEEYAIKSIPTMILLDESGNIHKRITGTFTKEQLTEELKCTI